jgi:hypothetical protein
MALCSSFLQTPKHGTYPLVDVWSHDHSGDRNISKPFCLMKETDYTMSHSTNPRFATEIYALIAADGF